MTRIIIEKFNMSLRNRVDNQARRTRSQPLGEFLRAALFCGTITIRQQRAPSPRPLPPLSSADGVPYVSLFNNTTMLLNQVKRHTHTANGENASHQN